MTCSPLFTSYYPQGCEGIGETCEICIPLYPEIWIMIVLGLVILAVLYIKFGIRSKHNDMDNP